MTLVPCREHHLAPFVVPVNLNLKNNLESLKIQNIPHHLHFWRLLEGLGVDAHVQVPFCSISLALIEIKSIVNYLCIIRETFNLV